MDRKAEVNDWDRQGSSAQALVHDVAGVARDVTTMAELQMRLFAMDFRAMRAALVRGAAAWTAGLVLLLGLLPVAIAGCGLLLSDFTRLSAAGGLLVAALAAAVLVAGLAEVGRRQFRAQQRAFDNSRRELAENLSAIKHMLSDYAGRSADEAFERT